MNTWHLLRFVAFFATAALAAAATPAQLAGSVQRFDEKKAIPHRLTRGDRLTISVFGEPDLTVGNKRVEARGTINLPLIQEIRVAGMTLSEAQTAIENAYRDNRFLRNPQITITVEEYAQRVVSISGRVNQPSRYEMPPEQQMTITDLIFKAGGFSETAKGTEVRVTRTLPDGTPWSTVLNVDSAIKGKNKTPSGDAAFVLQPDDIVYVPEKMF